MNDAAIPTGGPRYLRSSAWRWHFYAAFFVLPILLVLSVTGLVILLNPSVERIAYGDLLRVEPPTAAATLDAQVAAAAAAVPGAAVMSVVAPRDPGRSTQVDVVDGRGRSLSVYVDPTGPEVLGHIDNATRIKFVATQIHGTLWMGRWGSYLVEAAAGWTLVMVGTGIVLWYPRRRSIADRMAAAAAVGSRRWNSRASMRRLHSTVGVVFAPVLVVLVITGLPWSGFWGEEVWTRVVDGFDAGEHRPDEEPVSRISSPASGSETAGLSIAWASERTVQPSSSASSASPLGLDAVVARGTSLGMLPGFAVGVPGDELGTYVLSNPWPSRAQEERTVWLDQYTGELLLDSGWNTTYGALAKATSIGIEAHMGRQFGVAGAMVMGGACLAVMVSSCSGIAMYWRRRPRRSVGFPRRPSDAAVPPAARTVAVALGILFPLLGLTMLVAAGVDRWFIREVPEVRRLFGMRETTADDGTDAH